MSVRRAASTAYRVSHSTASLAGILICCAFSSGVHLALAPEHLTESPRLGAGFFVAAAMLLAGGLAVFMFPEADAPPLTVALMGAGLIAAYTASRTLGLPGLEPDPEPLDAIGLSTQVPQLAALILALRLYRENRSRHERLHETRRIGWTRI
jgi:hypothetical protein